MAPNTLYSLIGALYARGERKRLKYPNPGYLIGNRDSGKCIGGDFQTRMKARTEREVIRSRNRITYPAVETKIASKMERLTDRNR